LDRNSKKPIRCPKSLLDIFNNWQFIIINFFFQK
jgi:hypothetical protein